MDNLVLHPTETAQWHALVNEAQESARRELGEELESYLVFLLMRFIQKPHIADTVLATQYLESMQGVNNEHQEKLRDVGDQCLLFSGLFPHRAEKKSVKISYFVDLGRSAYHHLGSLLQHRSADIFHQLAGGFVGVMDVLHAMRSMDSNQEPLSPIQALELWSDTGSRFAYDAVKFKGEGLAVIPEDKTKLN